MNSHKFDQTIKLYLLECMDFDGYLPEGEQPQTTQEKIKACHDAFQEETGKWLISKDVSQVAALKEWLQGLPSCMTIAFSNFDILTLAVGWKALPENYTEAQAEKYLENYFNMMANKLNQLFEGYHVPKGEN